MFQKLLLLSLISITSLTTFAKNSGDKGKKKIIKEYITVKSTYNNEIPENIKVNIKDDSSEPEYLEYIFIKSKQAPIRFAPSIYADIIATYPFNSKLKVVEKVEVSKNEWYKVELIEDEVETIETSEIVDNTYSENNNTENTETRNTETAPKKEVKYGYVSANIAKLRMFDFKEMYDRVHKLEDFIKGEIAKGNKLASINTYIPNPSNENMDRKQDKYGVSADQNAMSTFIDNSKENAKEDVIFIPDRSIISISSEKGNNAYVKALSIPEENLKVNKKLISNNPKINPDFKKVIAISLVNENQGVFEKNSNGEWELISYTLNKTGLESSLGFETPKGYFIVPNLLFEMYYKDENNKLSGMAKYAIRFSGGGYIHGTPIEFRENINRDFFIDQKENSLGTSEGTRKCIRNTEEHIKFLFDWITNGKVDRKSNYQRPDENVMVIVY